MPAKHAEKRVRREAQATKREAKPRQEQPSAKTDGVAFKKNTTDPVEAANPPPTDRVVSINVGGTVITTLESTLRISPSQFTKWLDNNFRGVPRDEEGRPFLDCDVRNFRYMLNYLRGYGLPAKADDLVLLAEDAIRFEVKTLQHDIGVAPPPLWTFNAGPGVSPDGLQFTTADILSVCGSNALSPQLTHTITFKMDKCESVACGVIGLDTAREDRQIFEQPHSVSYRNTGEMVRYFGDEPLYCTGASYSNSTLITVRIRFMPQGCTNASLPPLVRALVAAPIEVATAASTSIAGRVAHLASALVPVFTTANMMGTASADGPPGTAPAGPSSPPQQGGGAASLAHVHAAPSVPINRFNPADSPDVSQNVAQTSQPFCLSPLSLPDLPIGAIIFFSKDDDLLFEARWPVPVPPLQFAVSMQGNSAVTILEAMSYDDHDERRDGLRPPLPYDASNPQSPAYQPQSQPQGQQRPDQPSGWEGVAMLEEGMLPPPLI